MNNDMRGLEVVAAKGRLLGLDMVYHPRTPRIRIGTASSCPRATAPLRCIPSWRSGAISLRRS